MKKEYILYDNVTNYGITIIDGKLHIVINDKVIKLDALIIKENKEIN